MGKALIPTLATTNGKEPLVQRQFCLLGGEEFSAPQKGKCAPTLYIECVFVSHSLTILFAEAFICFYICYEFKHYTLTIILIHKQHTTNAWPRLEFINRLTQAMHHILQKQFRRVYQELYYRERRDLFNVVKTSFRKMSRYFVLFYSEKRRFLVVPNRSKG